jgi:hypothetical protein
MPIPYNAELCKFLQLPGQVRQTYSGITTQVYPLQANPKNVEDFLHEFLLPNPFIEFQPVGPLVVMQICEYPKVETTSPGLAHRLFAFHEVAFGIPIAVYEIDDAGRRFSEYAMVYPFIFVDNPLSMAAGRQIYGWAKAGIEFQRLTTRFGPNDPRQLFAVRIDAFSLAPLLRALSRDDNGDSRTALAVNQTRPFLSGFAGIAQTLTIVPQALGGFVASTATLFDAIGNLMAGYASPTAVSLISDQMRLASGAVMNQFLGYLKALNPDFDKLKSILPGLAIMLPGFPGTKPVGSGYEVSIYTMKQVSDASERASESGCYEAVVRSRMEVVSAQDGGLLFDPIAADPTGGIAISLERDPKHKELDDLISLLAGATLQESNGREVYTVRPVLPFWGKLDLAYGRADRQWWRSKYSTWQEQPPSTIPRKPRPGYGFNQQINYLNKGSGAKLQVGGTRDAANAVLHIFPLPADTDKLQALVNRYLNDLVDQPSDRFRFEVKPHQFVYVTLLNYGDMQSPGAPGQRLGDRVLSFNVLVNYYADTDLHGGKAGPETHAFVPLYTFVGTDWNYITEYEVYGRLTFRSDLVSPEDVWIKQPDTEPSKVLTVTTTLFPQAEDAGTDETANRVNLVTIFSDPSSSLSIPPEDALGMCGLNDLLRLGETSWSIALKQVRNAIVPDSVDYQSIVAIERKLNIIEPINQFRAKIEIAEYDSFPLLDVMGLRANFSRGGIRFGSFEIPDSFSVRTSLHEEPGKELWHRVADQKWTRS